MTLTSNLVFDGKSKQNCKCCLPWHNWSKKEKRKTCLVFFQEENVSSKSPKLEPMKSMQMRKWVFCRTVVLLWLCAVTVWKIPFNPLLSLLFTVNLCDQQPRNTIFELSTVMLLKTSNSLSELHLGVIPYYLNLCKYFALSVSVMFYTVHLVWCSCVCYKEK